MKVLLALLALSLAAGCAYYNAMWSAERYAKDARRLEARGQEPEARAAWARAAAKAESVMVHHPRSRWADDALVLKAEGLARSGRCAAAKQTLVDARARVTEPALRERAALAAAQCALADGRPLDAEAAAADALGSQDRDRRSRAELLAGQAAAARFDYDGAVMHFRRSREAVALPGRARALLAAGRAADAALVIDTVAHARLRDVERAELFVQLAVLAGADVASQALDRQLRSARLPFGEQARLLLDDGDRLQAAGEYARAQERYRRVLAVVPVTAPEAALAGVRVQGVELSRASTRADVAPIVTELERLNETGTNAPAQRLLALLNRATTSAETPGARLRAAELARDSLGAPMLAGTLFLEAAAADTTSLYAPKALLAALPLLPDARDSITAVLESRYGTSPYTRAYHGEASVAYAAAEDSLARELGVLTAAASGQIARSVGSAGRVAVPYAGPRGPRLDDEPATMARTTPRPVRTPRVETERPVRDRPARPTSSEVPPP